MRGRPTQPKQIRESAEVGESGLAVTQLPQVEQVQILPLSPTPKGMKMKTYKIIRMYRDWDRESKVIMTGLTLEQAQEHCRREDTRGEGWFDGYEEEK